VQRVRTISPGKEMAAAWNPEGARMAVDRSGEKTGARKKKGDFGGPLRESRPEMDQHTLEGGKGALGLRRGTLGNAENG